MALCPYQDVDAGVLLHLFGRLPVSQFRSWAPWVKIKCELNPEMKLCEMLALRYCIHLPLILVVCAFSGQSYNIGSPVAPKFCDVIDTAMTGDPMAFLGFLNFYRKVLN